MFPSLFSGTLGCLKNVRIHLHLDPEVKPVRQKLRPLPFHLEREAGSKEIKKHIELGILEHVTDDMGLEHSSRFEGHGGQTRSRRQAKSSESVGSGDAGS